MNLTGVYTALVTPFVDGAVDIDTFRALCIRQIKSGVAGLVPCGTTGETPTLSDLEWGELVRTAVEVADNKVPVIAGCGSNSTAKTVETITRAKALGADAALVVFPYYNKPNSKGLFAHVEASLRVGLPIVLYHVPGRTGQRLPASQIATLCQLHNVIAIKEATGDVALGQELLELTDVSVLSGDDFTFAALRAMGAHGVISVVSNIAPSLTVKWDHAANTGDVVSLRALRTQLLPLIRFLFDDTNPVPAKAAMSAMGLCSNEVRLPLATGVEPSRALISGLE